MDTYKRDQESEAERIDRNWDELLQELRVSQTGVQILTGFLLTMPVQPAFQQLGGFERNAYVFAISMSIIATCLLIAPVAMHRILFRRRRKETLVKAGHRTSELGLAALALAIVGVVTLVFAIVYAQGVGLTVGLVTLVMFTLAWFVLPMAVRHRVGSPG